MATKPNGKSPVLSASDEKVMFFRDVLLGPHETHLRFRLIHFWEAWNPIKKTLIGLGMLLIDKQGTVIQGFISPGRIEQYLGKLKRRTVYKLDNFYGSSNKSVYRVSDHAVTVSLSWNSKLSVLEDITTPFDEDRFRFHSYEVFEANCDLKGDLYGTLALTSMSSSRVFMDYDVQPTIDYFAWLGSNPEVAGKVNADVVTKREQLTIGEIFSYIKQESAKEAFFECTATIDDVLHGSAWYCARLSVYDNSDQAVFVLLGDAGRALTGWHASELVSSYFEVINYQSRILDELNSHCCADCQANADIGVDQEAPVSEALINTIRQRHKFSVKVTEYNLSGKTRALTVTKILPLDTPTETETSAGNSIAATPDETFQTGNDVCEASKSRAGSADVGSKRSCDNAKVEEAKRPKPGN
ncbi:unnamed protein product [Brassica rapa subsp. trilocularis]